MHKTLDVNSFGKCYACGLSIVKKKMSAAKKMKPGPKRKISDSARKRKKKRGKRKVKQKQDLHWRPISTLDRTEICSSA